jgi:transcriptional regulator with XRE-family HTH domain
MYAFGKMMRRLIDEHDTSQAEISRATGINKQNISLMCNGKTQYPSIHACKLIATYFGLTLDELYAMLEAEENAPS